MAINPNIGGTVPNDAFADLLGLPTIWVPHSYPGCKQHSPAEHLPADDGLAIPGLFRHRYESLTWRYHKCHQGLHSGNLRAASAKVDRRLFASGKKGDELRPLSSKCR
ncbi:hypothetical protein [Falsirhodobacter xinxiangensis]|uniref:hypothetical protein n=1 Tax=Falsirhodobacter xinxiangensis TaxID=2530049 RepID=UPI001C705F6E|nr:hypothetical protein [Rhodobacter xinxiangensis]